MIRHHKYPKFLPKDFESFVYDPCKHPPIALLTAELLLSIFYQLSLSDFRHAALTCREWNGIINEHFRDWKIIWNEQMKAIRLKESNEDFVKKSMKEVKTASKIIEFAQRMLTTKSKKLACVQMIGKESNSEISCLNFDWRGERLISYSSSDKIRVHDVTSSPPKIKEKFSTDRTLNTITLLDRFAIGTDIVCLPDSGNLVFIDLGTTYGRLLPGHRFIVRAVINDGVNFYSGGEDGSIRMWDPQEKKCLNVMEAGSRILNLSYCAETNLLFSLSPVGKNTDISRIDSWDIRSNMKTHSFYSPSAKTLASSYYNIATAGKEISIIDIRNSTESLCLYSEAMNPEEEEINNIALRGDYCISTISNRVVVWNLIAGGYLGSMPHSDITIHPNHLALQNTTSVSCSFATTNDGFILLWEMR